MYFHWMVHLQKGQILLFRPSLTTGRTRFEYYEGAVRIPEGSAPNLKNQSWTITAEVEGGN